jgi:hypothetical protein
VPTPTPVRFAPGYGIVAVPGEKLPWETVERWLVRSRNYWICTTRPDGGPHAKPVWGVWLDGAVLWSTDDRSVTGRNLAANPAVCVHLESGRGGDPRGGVHVRVRPGRARALRRGL